MQINSSYEKIITKLKLPSQLNQHNNHQSLRSYRYVTNQSNRQFSNKLTSIKCFDIDDDKIKNFNKNRLKTLQYGLTNKSKQSLLHKNNNSSINQIKQEINYKNGLRILKDNLDRLKYVKYKKYQENQTQRSSHLQIKKSHKNGKGLINSLNKMAAHDANADDQETQKVDLKILQHNFKKKIIEDSNRQSNISYLKRVRQLIKNKINHNSLNKLSVSNQTHKQKIKTDIKVQKQISYSKDILKKINKKKQKQKFKTLKYQQIDAKQFLYDDVKSQNYSQQFQQQKQIFTNHDIAERFKSIRQESIINQRKTQLGQYRNPENNDSFQKNDQKMNKITMHLPYSIPNLKYIDHQYQNSSKIITKKHYRHKTLVFEPLQADRSSVSKRKLRFLMFKSNKPSNLALNKSENTLRIQSQQFCTL